MDEMERGSYGKFQHVFSLLLCKSCVVVSNPAQMNRTNAHLYNEILTWHVPQFQCFGDNNLFFSAPFQPNDTQRNPTYILSVLHYANVRVEPTCISSPLPILPRTETTWALSHQTQLLQQQSLYSPETKLFFSINK